MCLLKTQSHVPSAICPWTEQRRAAGTVPLGCSSLQIPQMQRSCESRVWKWRLITVASVIIDPSNVPLEQYSLAPENCIRRNNI